MNIRFFFFFLAYLFVFSNFTFSQVSDSQTFKNFQSSISFKSNVVDISRAPRRRKEPYKVSVIAFNINTWLENPGYFSDLKAIASKFPIENILVNLQEYNADLLFNDPNFVKEILLKDIYPKYLPEKKKEEASRLFANRNQVMSYSKKYHLYGVGACNYPYFGQPIEAKDKGIHLGFSKSQFEEAAVKFPDTDIFCVAMLNITPNWVYEGWDLWQINQEILEILVYMFDRNGRLIGGAGVPFRFHHNTHTFFIDQIVKSRVWQPCKHRYFYLLPEYHLMNTVNLKESPPELKDWADYENPPTLSSDQKYILSILSRRIQNKMSLEDPIFSETGAKLDEFLPKGFTPPINLGMFKLSSKLDNFLDKKNIDYQNDIVFGRDLLSQGLSEYFENWPEAKLSLDYKVVKASNEGHKLRELIDLSAKFLIKDVLLFSDKPVYTNQILPFESELDPSLYRRCKNEYYFLSKSMKKLEKLQKKRARNILVSHKRYYSDLFFWYKFINESLKNLATYNEIKDSFESLFLLYKSFSKLVLYREQLLINKDLLLIRDQALINLFKRNKVYFEEKYINKPNLLEKKLGKLSKIEKGFLDKWDDEYRRTLSNALLDNEKIYQEYLAKETELRAVISTFLKAKEDLLFPEVIQERADSRVNISEYQSEIDYFVKSYKLSNIFVEKAFLERKFSPIYRYLRSKSRKETWHIINKSHFLSFEGFVLILSTTWKNKVFLEDRMQKI